MDYILYILCFLFSGVAVRHFLSLLSRRQRNLPPGPTPLPIIGNLLSLGDKPHISLSRLSQTYGPIISLELGSIKTIVVSSPSIAKEVLQKNDISLSFRPIPDAVEATRHRHFSMVTLPPHAEWRNLRKIVNSLVLSSSRLDACSHLRKEKVNNLLSQVDACCKAGVAVDIGQAAFNTTLNLLSNTFFSVDMADRDIGSTSSRSEFKELVSQGMTDSGKPNLSDFFPLLKRLDIQGIRKRTEVLFTKLLVIFDGIINQRLEASRERCNDGDDTDNGDVLDALLKMTQENSWEGFNMDYLRHLLMDLFGAGTDTTLSTLEWAMTELLRNPTKMEKAQEELLEVIGKGNNMNETDISKLPYLQAVIKETFRLHPPVPFLIPRKAVTNIKLGGYTVSKDSQVLVNVYAIGRDPNVWEDANIFKPERFIDSNIDVKGSHFELTPFGAGRRICPGIPLAVRMIPMMLGSLIYSFDWKLEDEIPLENMDMEEKFGITLHKSQPLRVIPIKKS